MFFTNLFYAHLADSFARFSRSGFRWWHVSPRSLPW
jgi:hypothetical protein